MPDNLFVWQRCPEAIIAPCSRSMGGKQAAGTNTKQERRDLWHIIGWRRSPLLGSIAVFAGVMPHLWWKPLAASNGYAAIRRIFRIEGEAIANLSMKTRASATSTTMKNIRADGRSAKSAVVFLGKKSSQALLTIRWILPATKFSSQGA